MLGGKKLINKLKVVLSPGSPILELGSGTDWAILNKTYNVIGSDNSEEFLKHLANTYPNRQFLELDATTVSTEKVFDGIYSNKVLQPLTYNQVTPSIKKQ